MKPRDLALEPNKFGKEHDIRWKTDATTSSLVAAEAQHRCALEMRSAIKRDYRTIKTYCDNTGQGYQHVTQILRGAATISTEDIGKAVSLLGISVSFSSPSDATKREDAILAADSSLRDAFGAFYTPSDVSSYMVQSLKIGPKSRVLEPSFGDGSFLSSLKEYGIPTSNITGCEIDPAACNFAVSNGLLDGNTGLFDNSFFELPIDDKYDCVLGNPPYVRLRTMEASEASKIRRMSEDIQGAKVGEESSEWLPFLIKATAHLREHGNLGFVLPFDFTYVKYARATWTYLSQQFSHIDAIRVRERIFGDILQDVILFLAFDKTGTTDHVRYRCYESKSDLANDHAAIDRKVPIGAIVSGERAFQEALVSPDLLVAIKDSERIVTSSSEASFHIGYVCGNKDFFHPSKEIIERYEIPETSLICSAVSSRQLGISGVKTSTEQGRQWLWLPSDNPTDGEMRYIAHGESLGVQNGYKCRVRNPWWKVPGVATADLIMSVFGESPRLMINDAEWAISNSLLGVYLVKSVNREAFCASWYSPLTLLSIELEVHSLGGGVLIAVPREASRVKKLSSQYAELNNLQTIDRCLKSKKVDDAYMCGAEQVTKTLGDDALEMTIESIERIRRWRKH